MPEGSALSAVEVRVGPLATPGGAPDGDSGSSATNTSSNTIPKRDATPITFRMLISYLNSSGRLRFPRSSLDITPSLVPRSRRRFTAFKMTARDKQIHKHLDAVCLTPVLRLKVLVSPMLLMFYKVDCALPTPDLPPRRFRNHSGDARVGKALEWSKEREPALSTTCRFHPQRDPSEPRSNLRRLIAARRFLRLVGSALGWARLGCHQNPRAASGHSKLSQFHEENLCGL